MLLFNAKNASATRTREMPSGDRDILRHCQSLPFLADGLLGSPLYAGLQLHKQ